MTRLFYCFCALIACCVRSTPVSQIDVSHTPQPIGADETAQVQTLAQAVRDARGAGRGPYQAPSPEAMESFATGLSGYLTDHRVTLPPGIKVHAVDTSPMLTVFEFPPGHGVFVWRAQAAAPFIIEVPHSFSDLDTLAIGLSLFRTTKARALIVNGTQRRVGCAEGMETCPADVAHAPASYFQGVQLALMRIDPRLVPVAVHGFDATSERDPLLILSAAGTATPTQRIAEALSATLRPLADFPVKRFPEEIDRLGGTTCVQAQAQRASSGRMLHLELARSLRDRLRKDPVLLRQVGLTLLLLEAPP